MRGDASIAQQDFSVGIVRGMGPQAIDPRAMRDHINGLYEDDGGIYKRGGSAAHSDAVATPASHPMVWIWDGYFDAGRRTIVATQDTFYGLAADDHTLLSFGSPGMTLPAPSAYLEGMLFIGGGYIYAGSRKTANYTTGTVSVTNGSKTVTGSGTTWNTLVDAGMLFQRGNERVYPIASVDSTTQVTLRDPYEGVTGSGITYTFSPLYTITAPDPYESGAFYAVAANRLLTGSGNQLKYSEIKKPGKWTVTINAAEVPNTHDFAEGLHINGLGVIGQTVVIFTTNGIWTLTGIAFDIVDQQGNANHRIDVLSRELMAFGQTATWQQALIVPCTSGIFLIDGQSSPRRVSRPIDELYRTYVDSTYRPGKMAVYNDHVMLPIISSGGAVLDTLVARLDRPVKVSGQTAFPWSRLAGDGVSCPAYAVRFNDSTGARSLLGANKILARTVDCSGFWKPDSTNTLDADGVAPVWSAITRDYETGGLTMNTVRDIRPRYELKGTGATISAEYGVGLQNTTGPKLDQVTFGNFAFAADDQDAFFTLPCIFGESDGLHPKHCRVNEDTRLIRYRLRNGNACEKLRLRSLEQFIRPSPAVRR